jgi:hypothetical protein
MLAGQVMVTCLLAASLGTVPPLLTELGELRNPWPRTWMAGLLRVLIERTWDEVEVSLLLEATFCWTKGPFKC